MSKTFYYRQCQLEKGCTITTSWIPEKFAIKGKCVKLKKKNDEWDDGWTVREVFSKMEARAVENQAHNSDDIWKATSGSCPRGNK